jgi:hypothetical protein
MALNSSQEFKTALVLKLPQVIEVVYVAELCGRIAGGTGRRRFDIRLR